MRLAVYQPDIAPNLGAMIRFCACFGVPLDVIEPCGFPFSPKALRRTAMDYADLVDMTRHDDWAAFLTDSGTRRLVLLTTKADDMLWDFNFEPTDTILMGRESAGVPENVHARADARIKLPMQGKARSLNVAICASVAMAEALRQIKSSQNTV